MKIVDGEPVYLVGDLAALRGVTSRRIIALADAGRLPVAPHRDRVSGVRWWTAEDWPQLVEWSATRRRPAP